MQREASSRMGRLVRGVTVSAMVATVVSWVSATVAHAGLTQNHNETLVGADPRTAG